MTKYLFIILLILVTPLYAGTINPNNKDEQYQNYANNYDCVVRLITKSNNRITSKSSSVLISNQWVLTAAHIFHQSKDPAFILIDKDHYPVQKVFVHQNFKHTSVGEYDIAILKLEKQINKSIKYPKLYTKSDEVKKKVDIAGYGIFGTFDTGARTSDDKKRAGCNHIEYINKHILICVAEKPSKSALEILISHGDSGGGLFIDQKLAGINSLVLSSDGKADSSWSDESGHTRISIFYTWIQDIMSQN